MRKSRLALIAFVALSAPLAAFADTYTFNISTGTSSDGVNPTAFTASGTLTGSVNTITPPTLLLSGVTGFAQGYAFTGIAPLSTATGFGFDNLLFTDSGARHVDSSGVLLFLNSPAGTSLAHVYDSASGYQVDVFDPRDPGDITPFSIQTFDLNPSSVPEPATLALMGTGALGLLGVARRKLAR